MAEQELKVKPVPTYGRAASIFKELEEYGYKRGSSIPVDILLKVDNLAYGTDPLERAATAMGISSNTKVLEIGSGFGGPARFLAHRFGCHVTAVELETSRHDIAQELTECSGLKDRVTHVNDNIMTMDLGMNFDVVIAVYIFVHLNENDTKKALHCCYRHLKQGGKIYIEDFVSSETPDPKVIEFAVSIYACPYFPTLQQWERLLAEAGFLEVKAEDKVEESKVLTKKRQERFQADPERSLRVYGQELFDTLAYYYQKACEINGNGSITWINVFARK